MDTNHNREKGVGLKLTGYPTNEEKFYWIVAQESCHPKAAGRILERIKLNGYDLATVMAEINFGWLIEELSHIGVTVTFIEPLENWVDTHHDGEWPKEVLFQKVRRNIKG